MQRQRLNLGFKGGRNYLQGPDIFNETMDWVTTVRDDVRDIDFALHRLATREVEAVSGPASEREQPVAVCTYSCSAGRESVRLLETDREVTDRYPYPEDEMVEPMVIDPAARRGVLRGDSGFSDIETWVAMTKALHLSALPEYRGKWLFVRGRFPEYVRHSTGERAVVISTVFSEKLTRTEALLDGRKVGDIFFSMV